MTGDVLASADLFQQHLFPFGPGPRSTRTAAPAAYFLVTSWGHCGSIWLAGSFNLHDEVCATVGIGNPIESFTYYPLNRDPIRMAERVGGALSPYGFNAPHRPEFAPLRSALQLRGEQIPVRDTSRMPWYLFDEIDHIAAAYPFKVVGNIHGLTLNQMDQAYLSQPDILQGRSVVVLDLIRHPIGRTESAINATLTYHMADLESRMAELLATHADECLALERKYQVDFTEPRARAALHVYRQGLQNDVWAYELTQYPGAQRILMERLQSEREYFAHVFATLAQGRLTADDAYLDRVFAPENLGSGRQSTSKIERPAGPRDQYERWSAFERAEFARVAQRLHLPRLYFPFGYDFSFISDSWFSVMCTDQ